MSVESEFVRIFALKETARVNVNAKGRSLPLDATLEEIVDEIANIAGVFVPAALTVGQWSVVPGAGAADVDIEALPDDGGLAITALQYRIDGGAPVNFAGPGTGMRTIAFPGADGATSYDVETRAVNPVGAGAWSDIKSVTPEEDVGGNIITELLDGTPFGVAIVPGDPTVTLCYIETTGAGATTPCTDGDEIGTIECVPLGLYRTYPTGVKPVFHSDESGVWIEVPAGCKIFFELSAYSGGGTMLLCGAFRRDSNVGGNVFVLGAGNGTNSLWGSNARCGIEFSGGSSNTHRNDVVQSTGINIGSPMPADIVVMSVIDETSADTLVWRDGPYNSDVPGSWASKGNWSVNRLYFGSMPDESGVLEGGIYAAMGAIVTPTTGQRELLATYLGALRSLDI